ncbi:trace amine-associated receptor 13c-like [Gadus macrocephalus]|uniref:trace amine-associated receptor 13c-like n=1 Tax=Gadus macrocephalus TaxID=80720 RepID=UPI0028CB4CC5|nr:trace amine-associated receptor 13c-like [Gadus macrocephalus]
MSPLLRSPLAGSGPDLCYPLLLNTSCRLSLGPRFSASLLYILTFSLALLTVLLNLLLIVSISHFRQLHTPTNMVLLSLAGSDLLIGLVVMPLGAQYYISSCWFLGPWLCSAFYMLSYVLTSASVASILLISLDRYLAVCQPLRYASEVTMGRVQLAVGLCWSCAVVYNGGLLGVNMRGPPRRTSCQGECVVVVDGSSDWLDFLVTFLAPISTVVALYLQVFAAALSQARKMRSSWAAAAVGAAAAARRSELKAARRLGVVVVVFLLCYFPSLGFMGEDVSVNSAASFWSTFLLHLNSCLNPLLYALFYPWFRWTIRLIVTLQILKPNSSRATVLH